MDKNMNKKLDSDMQNQVEQELSSETTDQVDFTAKSVKPADPATYSDSDASNPADSAESIESAGSADFAGSADAANSADPAGSSDTETVKLDPELAAQFENLIKVLSKQNYPLEKLYIVYRINPDSYAYVANGSQPEILRKKALEIQAPLFIKIFEQKPDRDVIITCQSNYVVKAIAKNFDILPVLDDLPQIVGLKAKLCSGADENTILKTLLKHDACLLSEHEIYGNAVLAIGTSLNKISATVAIVEKSAQAMVEGKILGGAKKLSYLTSYNYRKIYLSMYSQMDKNLVSLTAKDYDRQISAEEMTLRNSLVDHGNRLVTENLTQGTWGNLSVRLDEQHMLITPSGMAYNRLTPYDMVRVNYHTLQHEGKLKPSVESGIHADIYRKHQKINGIIHTHSFNCSVFAAANKPLPIIMPAAITSLGSHSGYCPYKKPGSDELVKAVSDAITDIVWSCIMGNHGMIVCGSSLPSTFDHTLLMEQAARYYLDVHS